MEKQRKIAKRVTSDLNEYKLDMSDEAGRVHAAKCIGAATKRIEANIRHGIQEAIVLGQILISLKDATPHGEFGNLIQEHSGLSHRQSNKYMQAARGWAFIHSTKTDAELEALEDDMFNSLNEFIRITRDEINHEKVIEDQSNKVLHLANDERVELEEHRAQAAALDKIFRDHEADMASMRERSQAATAERESDPEWQKARRKAEWNWKQMAKQYTPDDRFFGLLMTPRFSDMDNLKIGFDFTDDELFEAFKAALIFGHGANEKKKSAQLLWDMSFEQHRDQLDQIREWHDKIGMCLQRLDDEGFRIEKPMPVREVK